MTITQKIFAVFSLLCSMALMPQEAQARINFTGYSDAQLQSILCTGEQNRCYSNITYNGIYMVAVTPYCKKMPDDTYWCSSESNVINMRANLQSMGPYTLFEQWFAIRSQWEEQTNYIYRNARVSGEYEKMISYDNCKPYVGLDSSCDITYETKLFDNNSQSWTISRSTISKIFKGVSHSCMGVGAGSSVVENYPGSLNPGTDHYYIPGFGCTKDRGMIVDKIPTSSDCERCDPASELAQLANPVISSMPGDKVSVLTGDNTQVKNDINGSIVFTRIYNSRLIGATTMGIGWRHNYDKKLEFRFTDNIENLDNPKPSTLIFTQENDNTIIFSRLNTNDPFTPALPSQSQYKLVVEGINYILIGPNGTKEKYNDKGQLVRITYRNDSFLNFTYDIDGKLIIIDSNYNRSLRLTYSDYADVVVKVTSSWGDYVDYTYEEGRIVKADFMNVKPVIYHYTGAN